MDEFGNILNNATQEANQTYQTDTQQAAAAQQKADQEYNNVNAEGASADANAAKLSALGDQYANTDNVTNMYNQDEQSQLNNMGFDKQTLNNADQNISQETGQLADANNQMAAQGGTRGFNAVGAENRQAGIQSQLGGAINANAAVQSNELGQANAASTYTGQEINAQQTSQGNAISAYNDAATQNNNTMANYANSLSTLAQQATQYGGLVGSNVANLMAGASSASQALLNKYQAQVDQSQVNLNNASAANQSAQAELTQQQIAYNKQMEPLQISAEKMVNENSAAASAQIASLTKELNTNENAYSTGLKNVASSDPFGAWFAQLGYSMTSTLPQTIANEKSQISQLQGNVIGANSLRSTSSSTNG